MEGNDLVTEDVVAGCESGGDLDDPGVVVIDQVVYTMEMELARPIISIFFRV